MFLKHDGSFFGGDESFQSLELRRLIFGKRLVVEVAAANLREGLVGEGLIVE